MRWRFLVDSMPRSDRSGVFGRPVTNYWRARMSESLRREYSIFLRAICAGRRGVGLRQGHVWRVGSRGS
jgi:hypothetical protein